MKFFDEQYKKRRKALLEENFKDLKEVEIEVLRGRYGIEDDGIPKTLEQLGYRLGLTRERVRQIETAALKKLEIK